MILSLNGSGWIVFDGSNSNVEQRVTKILLPNVNDAQQSPYLAVPLCLVDGDKSSKLIQAILDVLQPKLRTLQEEEEEEEANQYKPYPRGHRPRPPACAHVAAAGHVEGEQ
jgi:hypothetical protein